MYKIRLAATAVVTTMLALACEQAPTAPGETAFEPPAPDFSASPFMFRFDAPIPEPGNPPPAFWAPCLGENILITGSETLTISGVDRPDGSTLFKVHIQPHKNLIGTGETSGDVYQGTGRSPGQIVEVIRKNGTTANLTVTPQPIVLHGNGGRLLVWSSFRLTQDANGNFKVFRIYVDAKCP